MLQSLVLHQSQLALFPRDQSEMDAQPGRPSAGTNAAAADTSVEREFENVPVPTWGEQLTVRAFVVSLGLAVMFCFIVMKLNLTTGIVPSLNIAAGLLGFFFLKSWTKVLHRAGVLRQPFTRQENTVIQTCAVAAYGVAANGGYATYLFGMSQRIADQIPEASDPQNVKELRLGWMIGFGFIVSFIGLFSIVPLRKIMIIDYKLTYPSGTATALLINGFHTATGAEKARKQVKTLGVFFSISFLWSCFQWFFSATAGCGFHAFPTFGLEAYKNTFYFDFSTTYVGIGMLCPYIVDVSLLIGAIVSWGIMRPLVRNQSGNWFAADLPDDSLRGLQAYMIFVGVALILGDGLYTLTKLLFKIISAIASKARVRSTTAAQLPLSSSSITSSDDGDRRRTDLFLKDRIPNAFAITCYITIAAVATATLPHIFPPLKWYYIVCMYMLAPLFAFSNAYGTGLTDMSLASTYGLLADFIVGSWAGKSNGGVLAGIAASAVVTYVSATAADLMQDFKTGYLTLASPRSMFVSQVIGTAIGCVVSPCVFWLFYKAFGDLGLPGSQYPAPFALVSRNIAVVGVQGFGALPKHCLTLSGIFFCAAIAIDLLRDFVPEKAGRFIPLPMAMAVPFYAGSNLAIDMCLGGLIVFGWNLLDKAKAEAFAPAVASGLISGDGVWSLPQSMLSLAQVQPPICMKFLSRRVNAKVDVFLAS